MAEQQQVPVPKPEGEQKRTFGKTGDKGKPRQPRKKE